MIPTPEISIADLLTLVFQTLDEIQGIGEQMAVREGVTRAHFRALLILVTAEKDAMALSELAERLGVSKANVTTLVHRMESRGLVERLPNDLDGRSVLIRPSVRSRKILEDLLPRRRRLDDTLLQAISVEERRALFQIVTKILTWLRSDEPVVKETLCAENPEYGPGGP